MGILCQGRGSAANSSVCYCLGITEVDTDKNEVLFERFLSNERDEPPDIDVDFEHERREEIIQWIYERKAAARRPRRHGDRLSQPQRHPRRRQGARPVTRYPGRHGQHGVGQRRQWHRSQARQRSRPRCQRSAAGPGARTVGDPDRLPAPPVAACRRLRADRRAPRRAGADPERGDGGSHRHRMGQGRSRRAQDLQGRRAGARHADGAAQELRPDQAALRRRARPRHAAR